MTDISQWTPPYNHHAGLPVAKVTPLKSQRQGGQIYLIQFAAVHLRAANDEMKA